MGGVFDIFSPLTSAMAEPHGRICTSLSALLRQHIARRLHQERNVVPASCRQPLPAPFLAPMAPFYVARPNSRSFTLARWQRIARHEIGPSQCRRGDHYPASSHSLGCSQGVWSCIVTYRVPQVSPAEIGEAMLVQRCMLLPYYQIGRVRQILGRGPLVPVSPKQRAWPPVRCAAR